MSYLIFDEETTTGIVCKRKASPFGAVNRKCALGWKIQGGKILGEYYSSAEEVKPLVIPPEVTMLVGHNIKFDLLWEWANENMQDFIRRGGKVWCTQYAEYLLEGQQQKYQMCAMTDIAEKYGGNTKVDAVKAMWEEGIDTPDIPQDLLMRYLLGGPDPETGEEEHGDIGNTELIFLGQVKRAKAAGMAKMIMSRMEGLLATTEMEFNGLCVDEERGETDRVALAQQLADLDESLVEYIPEDFPCEFKWTSPIHKSALIFGGTVKYQKWVQHTGDNGEPLYAQRKEKWPLFRGKMVNPGDTRLINQGTDDEPHWWYGKHSQDTFAGGKQKGNPKFKVQSVPDMDKPKGAQKDHFYTMPGYTTPRSQWEGARKGVYSVSADVIEALGNRDVPFLKALAARGKADKLLGTYYWVEDSKGVRKGMLTLVDAGFIHHSLNHTSTVTTRLSASNPNSQNVPRGDKSTVKAVFISRFGDDGEMGEVDYSQLEVVVQGVLSGDLQLCQDLRDRVDFHCKRLAYKLSEDYEEVRSKAKNEGHAEHALYAGMRTDIKGFSFQRAYGAGAEAISDATGIPVDEVKELIAAEEIMYPGVTAFNNAVAEAVKESRWSCRLFRDNPEGGVVQYGKGEWYGPTGTRYVWEEHPAPAFMQKRGTLVSFSPPEMKNYPVQGLGGEIVQVILGKLFRAYVKRGWWSGAKNAPALLVNTVHDCVWNDMRKEVRDEVLTLTCAIMESVPEVFNAMYPDLEIDVPFPVEAECGPNMLDLHHWSKAA
jgi:DNA polymerase I-like protein with 3'-5' exonuclease and polymerase domains